MAVNLTEDPILPTILTDSEFRRAVENKDISSFDTYWRSMQKYLKDLHRAVYLDINSGNSWIEVNERWTYNSADSPVFALNTFASTAKYSVGMKVKLTQGTDKYFFIVKIDGAYLYLYGGTDYTLTSDVITAAYYSFHRAPLGFPLDPLKWTVFVRYNETSSKTGPSATTWYNQGSYQISVPIGSWGLSFQSSPYVSSVNSPGVATGLAQCLSTATNSSSHIDLIHFGYTSHQQISMYFPFHREAHVTVDAKTPYYLNILSYSTLDASDSIGYLLNYSITTLKAVCAFL